MNGAVGQRQEMLGINLESLALSDSGPIQAPRRNPYPSNNPTRGTPNNRTLVHQESYSDVGAGQGSSWSLQCSASTTCGESDNDFVLLNDKTPKSSRIVSRKFKPIRPKERLKFNSLPLYEVWLDRQTRGIYETGQYKFHKG